MTTKEHIKALNDLARAEHEADIAEAERLSAEAPDEYGRWFYAERARRYREMVLPGDPT